MSPQSGPPTRLSRIRVWGYATVPTVPPSDNSPLWGESASQASWWGATAPSPIGLQRSHFVASAPSSTTALSAISPHHSAYGRLTPPIGESGPNEDPKVSHGE